MIAFQNALRTSTPWLIAALVVSLTACTAAPGGTSSEQAPQPRATRPQPTPTPGTTTPEPKNVGKLGDTLQQHDWKMRLTRVASLSAEQATLANGGTPLSGDLYVFYVTVVNTGAREISTFASDFQLDLSGDVYLTPINCCATYATQQGGRAATGLLTFPPSQISNILVFVNRPAGSKAETFRYTDGKGLRWTVAG